MAQRLFQRLRMTDRVVDLERFVVTCDDGTQHTLTQLETDLLGYLFERSGQIVASRELLTAVWGYSERTESRAVAKTVSRLRAKIESEPAEPTHLVTVYGAGLRLQACTPAVTQRQLRSRDPATFFGREDVLKRLHDSFDTGRLTTIVGPGGCGKTRVAVEFSTLVPDAIVCPLESAQDVPTLCRRLSMSLDLPLLGEDPVARIGEALRNRGDVLVVLDEFEHLLEFASATIGRWLSETGVRFLVTSRMALRIRGERLLDLPPLPLPDADADVAELRRNPAFALFVDRASAASQTFELSEDNAADVLAIVHALDGLPLALELAAARIRVLPTPALRRRVSEDNSALRTRNRDVKDAHTTLRAAFDGSWRLLGEAERSALAQTSVFVDVFSLEAAEAVVDLGRWPDLDALDVLEALVDASMVVAVHGRQPRFRLLRTLRTYARNRLNERAEAIGALQRHGAWFSRLGVAPHVHELEWDHAQLARLSHVLPDVQAACDQAMAQGDEQTAERAALVALHVIGRQGPFSAGLELVDRVLAMTAHPAHALRLARARMVTLAGDAGAYRHDLHEVLRDAETPFLRACANLELACARWNNGALDEAWEFATAAQLAFERAGDERRAGVATGILAGVRHYKGDLDGAELLYCKAMETHEATGNMRHEGLAALNLGGLLSQRGELKVGEQLLERAVETLRTAGERRAVAVALGVLSNILLELGRLSHAADGYRTVINDHRALGDRAFEATELGNLGLAQQLLGEWAQSRATQHRALDMHLSLGNRRCAAIVLGNLATLEFWCDAPEDALTLCERGLEDARATGDTIVEACLTGRHVQLLCALGQPYDHKSFTRAGEILRTAGVQLELAHQWCFEANVALREGREQDADTLLDRATRIADERGLLPESQLRQSIRRARHV